MFGIAVLSLRARDVAAASVPDGSLGDVPPPSRDVEAFQDTAPLCRSKTRVPMSRNASFAHVCDAATERRAADETLTARAASAADLAGLNPLRPCGACKEWLNKIAESNPGFRVLMFSDVSCDEVYVKEVGQC